MSRLPWVLIMLVCWPSLFGQIKLPDTLRLAGPLNQVESGFGDEFFNFPSFFEGKAEPGATYLSGWIEFEFSPAVQGEAEFTLTFSSVGTPDGIVFPGGQTYTLVRNKAFSNPAFVSRGTVDLTTGEVSDLEIHAMFQNSVIEKVTRNIRIPFGFINDYPPAALPVELPFSDEPRIYEEARFAFDSSGNITGFEFRGETIAAVTLFPRLGIFPPYSFGDEEGFYFANPTGCLPDAPPENCITDENNPDGIRLASNAFFHPHLELISDELREMPAAEDLPGFPCMIEPVSSGNGLVAISGLLYQPGGSDDEGVNSAMQVYDRTEEEWTLGAFLPLAVKAAQSVSLGSKLHLVGGLTQEGVVSDSLQVFDPATQQWSFKEPAPIPVYAAAAVESSGRLYLMGGWSQERANRIALTGAVQVYDPASNSWSFGTDAPVPTAGWVAVNIGSVIYLINGQVSELDLTNRVWIYDPAADSWTEGPRTLRGLYQAAAGFIENRIYVAGGRTDVDGQTVRDVQILDFAAGYWRRGLELPLPTAASSGTVMNNKFVLAGGRSQGGATSAPGDITRAVQVYDPAKGWSVCDSSTLFTATDVLNGACGAAGPIELSPGGRAVISGYNFAESEKRAQLVRIDNTRHTSDLPKTLNGVTVWVDGRRAALLSVAPTLIEFQVPYEVQASSRLRRMVPVRVMQSRYRQQQKPVLVPLLAAAPAVFVYNFGEFRATGYLDRGTAIARNSDGLLNHPSQPASPGEKVILLTTGFGVVDPILETGQRAASDPSHYPGFKPTVQVGGSTAEVLSVRLAPQEIGVYELEVIIPNEIAFGNNIPITVQVSEVKSNTAVISIR